jgi:hypothetical protein
MDIPDKHANGQMAESGMDIPEARPAVPMA